MTEILLDDKVEGPNPGCQDRTVEASRNGTLQTVVPPPCVAEVHNIRKADGTIVEGSFYNHFSFAAFLNEWLVRVKKSKNIVTSILSLTDEVRGVLKLDQKTLYHSVVTIAGFPPTEFFGCGFGRTLRQSKWAACREIVVRLYCANLVTPIQFNRIGSSDLLSKTAKRKYRAQWSIVKRNVDSFESVMLINDVPAWFLYGPYNNKKVMEQKLIDNIREIVDGFKNSIQNEDDCYNSEMRRKRRTEDQMEVKSIAGSCDAVIKALRVLDSEKPIYAKKPRLMSHCHSAGVTLLSEDIKTDSVDEAVMKHEGYKKDLDSCSPQACELWRNEDFSGGSDCEIIDAEQESRTIKDFSAMETQKNDENSVIKVDIPSTSKGIISNAFEDKVNDLEGNGHVNLPAALSPKPNEEKYMKLCEKLGVSHIPSATFVFELIKQKRIKYPKEFDAFDKHIWDHFQMNAQDDHTFTWKMRVREKLLSVVRRLYPNARLIAVGSTINGCGAYNSDMDLCMCLPEPLLGYHTGREHGLRVLKKVYRELAYRSKGLVRMATFIPAKVPIIKLEMEAPFDELEVDINCNNIPGIYNSHLLHYYARIDDRFPALCLLVKHWAINAGINDAMTGTFNSYSLILLVLHFLQCGVLPPVLPNLQALFPDQFHESVDLDNLELFKELRPLPKREINSNTVGELLIAFFDYYSRFDFTCNAISVSNGRLFPRSNLPLTNRRYKIYIEEPFDLQNTARCVTRIENLQLIKFAFTEARKAFLSYKSKGPTLASINVR